MNRFLLLLGALFAGSTPLIGHEAEPFFTKELENRSFDLVVVTATPAGVATAVRAAREGLSVLLTNHTTHLGGMLSNGLGIWDTVYAGRRSPLYDELYDNILNFYRDTYGANSPQYAVAKKDRGTFEAKVAETVVEQMVRTEKNIIVLKGWYPVQVERQANQISSVIFQEFDGKKTARIKGRIFADASYEGDLAALAKVPYKVGRESRAEFNEPHAGQIFTKVVGAKPQNLPCGPLNLRSYSKSQKELPGGTGEGDKAIQAFNFRVTLSKNPANRVPVSKPAGYDKMPFETIKERWSAGGPPLPNDKASWNSPLLIAGNHDYPEANWAERAKITARHRDFAIGLLWFLQNDPSIPKEKQAAAREWGLAKDEFTDNGHMPYEMYVREARRIVGRTIFTELDGLLAPNLHRAPIHADSIAVTEWPLDSHECTLKKVPGSVCDGKVLLTGITVPGQISYNCLLPKELNNLLVPICLSATHIGWGTVRLEPTAMSIGESAGFAASLAVKNKTTPGELNPEQLLALLASQRVMISFFNDIDVSGNQPWIAAIQYLGTKGYFPTYNARPEQPLTAATAQAWAELFGKIASKQSYNPTEVARTVPLIEKDNEPGITAEEFLALLKKKAPALDTSNALLSKFQLKPASPLSRAAAAQILFELHTAAL